MANQFNSEFSSPIIEEVHENGTDYILVPPTEAIMWGILNLGALTLEANVPGVISTDFQKMRWDPANGGFENPLEYHTCIRLHKVPLHLWNSANIHTLISVFGYALRIS